MKVQDEKEHSTEQRVTFLKEPSIKEMFPLSSNAKTLESSNSIALPYDCLRTKMSIRIKYRTATWLIQVFNKYCNSSKMKII